MTREEIIVLTKEIAFRNGIEERFLLALVATESNFKVDATRYEPGYIWIYSPKELSELLGITREEMVKAQKTSYGLAQVMGSCFYELGFRGLPDKLFEPTLNLSYACKHLNREIEKHKLDVKKIDELYACYNAGSVRRIDNGILVNQRNVNRFMKIYNAL